VLQEHSAQYYRYHFKHRNLKPAPTAVQFFEILPHSTLLSLFKHSKMRSSLFFSSVVLSLASGILAQSGGCGKPIPEDIKLGTSKNQTINSESGHTPRKYRIHLPKTYDVNVPVPLILSYHGRNKDMKFQERLSQFANASYGFEGISVFPEGVPVSLLLGRHAGTTEQLLERRKGNQAMARRSRLSTRYQRRQVHLRAH